MISRSIFLLLLLCSSSLASLTLKVFNFRGYGLRDDPVGPADAYIRLRFSTIHTGLTRVQPNTANPVWKDRFEYGSAKLGQQVILQVFDQASGYDPQLGYCSVYVKSGSHSVSCKLSTGGRLDYMYSLM
uniref:C2 domain-containing protein n=1 Tax=Salarias fasciatus TaxID=181472 RepID=A0A672F591_SALFA